VHAEQKNNKIRPTTAFKLTHLKHKQKTGKKRGPTNQHKAKKWINQYQEEEEE